MNKIINIKDLKKKAVDIRRNILIMLEKAGSGHTGGSLSIVEILIFLYYYKMNLDCSNYTCSSRDRFILSKGHGCPALYAVLADLGFFSKEELMTLRQIGSRLQGHPQFGVPGIEISSGSLGQGLSIANGFALSNRMDKISARIYCLMGDGETNEGQVWEAAMTSAHYNLHEVCGIIDYNKLQIDGMCCEVKSLGEYHKKWESFGWHVIETDGHDFEQLKKAFLEADSIKDKPQIVIAHTTKGKGISFVENKVEWHGISPNKEQLKKALAELDAIEKFI
ncbi:transketolase, beta subunit [Candidatus Omnitrophus magneticus]|uniref:Transketolase, beta subunit n=1 Tax=Candidatus Omnitrophus magneticus TaxID=1609969 RepID=A0A0F0CRP5_9BACT|nr:transketolase, beta subunit [Candidatus Omnitrophus magneticus]